MARAQRVDDSWHGIDPCHTCGLPEVRWYAADERGTFLVHRDGKSSCRFPCRSRDCGHLDCAAARGDEHQPEGDIIMATKKSTTTSKRTTTAKATKSKASKSKATKSKATKSNATKSKASKSADVKVCPRCGKEKPADTVAFFADKNRPDGLTTWCKSCWAEHRRAKRAASKDANASGEKPANPSKPVKASKASNPVKASKASKKKAA